MAKLKTDSPLARRIAQSFISFLDSVEPASGVDAEGIEVAKECLSEAFKIELSSENQLNSESLVDIFSSWETVGRSNSNADLPHEVSPGDCASTSSAGNASDAHHLKPSYSQVDGWSKEDQTHGTSKDELFGQYFGALEKIRYFKSTADGNDDQAQLDRATHIFHKALEEMQRSGCQTFDGRNLAETLKLQGNKAMQLKLYLDAIELYTFAIALCEDNAVYYCNRAAAYTQINHFEEAINDCLKSIEIDPNYSKAYSRLGFAYYAQGKYRDAIDKGFIKALQLDPNNSSVKENIRVAEQKLREEQQRAGQSQNSSSNHHPAAGSRSHGVPPPFTSMPFDATGLPVDIASMFMNMAPNLSPGQNFHSGHEGTSSTDAHDEPEIRMGGNINVDLGEHMPEEFSGALRSMMQMFSGAAPHGNPEENVNGRSAPS
ncbi:unnamed protein product [Coffea canephora]|uniref:SGTA homodimerisation domain-containing protein n=2 Tax=Coffea TaxID=13442 RepID=A0A068UQS9_COFCA|nr:small glutamine-rich tetratricopeptide repeat-containing protein alpha-like [Coffea arabica]CDP10905.1 unnamed protein product [Coffea canephora]